MKQSNSIKTVFVDVNGVQYTVELKGGGRAVLFDGGFAIYQGTVQGIRAMGLVPKLEYSKNSSKGLDATRRIA